MPARRTTSGHSRTATKKKIDKRIELIDKDNQRRLMPVPKGTGVCTEQRREALQAKGITPDCSIKIGGEMMQRRVLEITPTYQLSVEGLDYLVSPTGNITVVG